MDTYVDCAEGDQAKAFVEAHAADGFASNATRITALIAGLNRSPTYHASYHASWCLSNGAIQGGQILPFVV